MKTLYININGEAIQSDDNIEVIGSIEDAIVDSFYISLGMAIADGVTGIKYKPLVADFAKTKPEEFKLFTKQWNEIKTQLLGDNPSGEVEFILTPEYLEWLKMNGTYFTIYNKKYQGQRQAVIKLSLDELYEDTLYLIGRRVIHFLEKEDNYKNFDAFVVNDEAVTRRSLIVRSIKSRFEDLAFMSYEKWMDGKDLCHKRGKNPCEYLQEKPVCPKCGKNPCVCSNDKEWSTIDDLKNGNIILAGITLNRTTLKDLRTKGITYEKIQKEMYTAYTAEINNLSISIPQCRYKDRNEIIKETSSSLDIDFSFFANEGKKVKGMTLTISSEDIEEGAVPFISEMGMGVYFDYDQFIEMFEDFGYVKVENPYNDCEDDPDFFIHPKTWLMIGMVYWVNERDENIYELELLFETCYFNELFSYTTGKIIRRNDANIY